VDLAGVLDKQTRDYERAGKVFGLALALMLIVTAALVAAWVFKVMSGEFVPPGATAPEFLTMIGSSDFAKLSGVSAGLSTWLGAKAWSAHRHTTVLLIARVLDLEGNRDAAVQLVINKSGGGRGANLIEMVMSVFD
jgi:hypothetical protein